ncbi:MULTISPECIES: gamma-glutamyltransferase [unclassified Beijerinckia]|uniref:gamma-glutamyltransferase n=1 Tax=unclassified Beijerinckia TaxID=2638183 RepID=UPI000895132D|nr:MULTISPECIES: gamma-glutamyltransferase [unclassified Beijerinckia]MDH7796836.1 gamma-glutamyltranspeptidase/glutathione hydrolase [Beijerinckia sp. GAS462]SEC61807.1 gamma-glutamyltranspeptidase / glutathione hydrolase [Beijerinckia sp. 28-YEA-48]
MIRTTGWVFVAALLVATTAQAQIKTAQVKTIDARTLDQRPADPAPIIANDARILPALATHGMVASQEVKASRIGVDILRRGGNAVDAAVAVGFALAVTLPRAGNLGGGGFMMVHLAKQKKTIAIDYRETAPADTASDVFLDKEGEFVPERSQSSGLGVGVPGTVAGLALAHRKYGSGKLTLAQLIAPAIALARNGFIVEDDLADSLPQAARRLNRYASSRAIFLHPNGTPLGRGDRLVQRDLARTLQRIARQGEAGFYQGETAQKLIASIRERNGRMTLDDLKTYQVVEREPVRGTYRGHEIVSMPPPSSGGVHLIELLNILEAWPIGDYGHNSAQTVHLMAEAMKHAYADRSEFMGDPDFVKMPEKGLLSKAYAKQVREQISPDKAKPSIEIKPANPQPYESDQTTHYSVVDKDGNAVSNTYTLNFSYGLGLVADGTGVLLNNELDDFAAKAGAMNAYGLLGGAANAPAPRKRPLSSMTPTFVFKDGELEIVTGSPGGSRIITIVLQVIMNIIDHRMNAAEATEAVRVHHQWQPDELRVERGLSIDTIKLLEAKGHNVRIGSTFGSAQTIYRAEGVLMGTSDTRQRGGGAVGY